MNSLQDLNIYNSSFFQEITDDRFATVIFDRLANVDAQNQILDVTSVTNTINPGLEILEIINYSTANVRYEITITPGAGWAANSTSIEWTVIPTGVTYSKVGNTYTLTGLRDVIDWETVSSFTWRVPSNYDNSPLWYLTVKVIYFDEELGQDQERTWLAFDPDFYTVAQLNGSSSLACEARRLKLFNVQMNPQFTIIADEGLNQQGRAQLNVQASMNVVGSVTSFVSITSSTSTNIIPNRIFPTAVVGLSSAFNYSIAEVTYEAIQFATLSRTYRTNDSTAIFSTNTPVISDPVDGTFTVSITATSGDFGLITDEYSASSTLNITGDKSTVNSWFSDLRFFPVKNSTASLTGTITISKSGSYSNLVKTFSLTNSGATSFTPQVYDFTSNATWSPKTIESKYCIMDYIVIGGGGGGASTTPGGGGGGGEYKILTSQSILQTSYSVVVGQGGNRGGGSNSDGAVGGTSSFNGLSSTGGLGGISSALNRSTNGGASANGNAGGIGFTLASGNNAGGGGGGYGGYLGGSGIGGNASGNTGGAGGAGIAAPTGYGPALTGGSELCRGGWGNSGTTSGTYLTTAGSGGGGGTSGPGGQNGKVVIKTRI